MMMSPSTSGRPRPQRTRMGRNNKPARHRLVQSLIDANTVLNERVRAQTVELRASYREAVLAMVRAAELKDNDTGAHSRRIGLYCEELATRLGMDHQFRDEILYASPMHDIGKLAIPDTILLKQGAHTADEWAIMQTHAVAGAQLLSDHKSPYLKMGVEIALHHHERWDGGGYPSGLVAEAIPVAARIMVVCDVYDACRSARPYKPAFDHARTIAILRDGDGRTRPEHFDPAILHRFLASAAVFEEIYQTHVDP